MTHSKLRGHNIEYINNELVYSDTKNQQFLLLKI